MATSAVFRAIKNTMQIELFDEANLAQLILNMCPQKWQHQYSPTQGIIPQDIQSLLDIFETIKNGKAVKKEDGSNGGKSREKEKTKSDK